MICEEERGEIQTDPLPSDSGAISQVLTFYNKVAAVTQQMHYHPHLHQHPPNPTLVFQCPVKHIISWLRLGKISIEE